VEKQFQNLQNRLQTIGFYEGTDRAEIDFEVCLSCAVYNCMFLFHFNVAITFLYHGV